MHMLVELRFAVMLVVLACFFLIAQAEADDKRKYLIDPATTAINQITIATTERDIVRRLGKPKSIERSYSEVKATSSKYLHYDGLKIYLIDGDIYNLSCTGRRCQTDRGVKVGDSKAKVIGVYGPGNTPNSGATQDSLSYPLKGIDSYLVFVFEDNKVAEIEFFVDYV